MSYRLLIATTDEGNLSARLQYSASFGDGEKVDAAHAVAEYLRRYERIAERNPEMSQVQVSQYVLKRWMAEVQTARERD